MATARTLDTFTRRQATDRYERAPGQRNQICRPGRRSM